MQPCGCFWTMAWGPRSGKRAKIRWAYAHSSTTMLSFLIRQMLNNMPHLCLCALPSRFSCAWHTNSTLLTALLRHISLRAMD
eukprot:6466071-Amphidinium_carterae.1